MKGNIYMLLTRVVFNPFWDHCPEVAFFALSIKTWEVINAVYFGLSKIEFIWELVGTARLLLNIESLIALVSNVILLHTLHSQWNHLTCFSSFRPLGLSLSKVVLPMTISGYVKVQGHFLIFLDSQGALIWYIAGVTSWPLVLVQHYYNSYISASWSHHQVCWDSSCLAFGITDSPLPTLVHFI